MLHFHYTYRQINQWTYSRYYHRSDALDCMKYTNGTKLDERVIRCDLDPGFKEGRQFGRGKSGGQVRDEYRTEYDVGRGGWGHRMRMQLEHERERNIKENYEPIKDIPQGAEEYKSRAATGGQSTKRRYEDNEEESRKRQKEQVCLERFYLMKNLLILNLCRIHVSERMRMMMKSKSISIYVNQSNSPSCLIKAMMR